MKISKLNTKDILSLTSLQEGILFQYLKDPVSGDYVNQLVIDIMGTLDIPIFHRAWQIVSDTHDALRTTFVWGKVKEPVQIVLKEWNVYFNYHDLTNGNSDKQEIIKKVKSDALLLAKNLNDIPFVITVIRITQENYQLIISNHHILYDGWSNSIILEHCFQFYKTLVNNEETLKDQDNSRFKDFVIWQKSRDQNLDLNYWTDFLRGYEGRNPFPERFYNKNKERTNETYSFKFSTEISNKIEQFSKKHSLSIASIFYSAWGILIHKYCNSDDIVFGTTVSGRPPELPHINSAVGLFINTVPTRIQITKEISNLEVVKSVFQQTIERKEYENYSLVKIQHLVKGNNNLFDTIVVFENYPIKKEAFRIHGLSLENISVDESTHYNLSVEIKDFDGFRITYSYKTDIVSADDCKRLNAHFCKIIEEIITNENGRTVELDIITDEERKLLENNFGFGENCVLGDETFLSLFAKQVKENSTKIALVYEDIRLSYKELDELSNSVANYLFDIIKVKPNDLIGIMVEKSHLPFVCIIGILKSGAAFVPIDPAYPKERIKYIIDNSQCKAIITNNSQEDLTFTAPLKNIQDLMGYSTRINIQAPLPEQLAYVIYTSGSTGTPKGVMLEHRGIANLYNSQKRIFEITPEDNLLQFSSLSFDASIWEFTVALLSGATLVVPSSDIILDVHKFESFMSEEKISIVALPPTYLKQFNQKDFRYLRILVTAGESPIQEDVVYYSKHYKYFNSYGPTEFTVCASCHLFTADNLLVRNIGRPILNSTLYILDKYNNLMPAGYSGELCLSGSSIARGYLNRDELTLEKFISNPFRPNDRIYKTGDLARWLPDGNLEFLGRIDHQVKIRGFRIECGEIESRLIEHQEIENAIIIPRKSPDSEEELVAYYQSKLEIEPLSLKSYLKEYLPYYMIPSYFIRMEGIPLNSNGKIDRKALLDVQYNKEKSEIVRPKNSIEQDLFDIWASILGHRNISTEANFFDVGGDSLKLIRLSSQIQQKFNIQIQISDLFDSTTIKSQTEFLKKLNRQDEKIESQINNKDIYKVHEDNIVKCDIAIIGMSGRFPGAENYNKFWECLKLGKDLINREHKEGESSDLIFAKGKLDNYDCFDAAFFDYTPNEAKIMDPQIRLFHECAIEALEDAGIDTYSYRGKIGLFGGASYNPFFNVNIDDYNSEMLDDGWENVSYADKDFLCSRVAYRLNLKGPIVNINTACSTSLVAVDYAYNALIQGNCDVALAGGVSLSFHDNNGYVYQKGRILSSDGYCKAFDRDADGTIGGNGMGIIVLKKLSSAIRDGDNIHAVIKGTAINNDGNQKIGFTAPSIVGQSEVISMAMNNAKVNSESITYIETHGTGTKLGDPVEFEGLKKAFNTSKKQFCGIGSVKTNIGHLDAAAGIAGVIKVVLALKNKQIPPSLHFKEPNSEIDFDNSPFFVNTELIDWKNGEKPRRAGVSSFGIGGTNAHVIIEEAPIIISEKQDDKPELFFLSAKTSTSLVEYSNKLIDYLERNDNSLADIAYTLRIGRASYKFKHCFVANNKAELIDKLKLIPKDTAATEFKRDKIVFMFSGQGNQYSKMTVDLYTNSEFYKKELDNCFEIIKSITNEDYKDYIFGNTSVDINQTLYSQPLLFIVEYSLAKYLMHIGIVPDIMIGHSIGEYTAACLSGVFSLEDTIKIVLKRGELMDSVAKGSMISIQESIQKIQAIIPEDLSIATVNSQNNIVISGTDESIKRFQDELNKLSIAYIPLTTSHAFHSSMMDGILQDFENYVVQFTSSAPEISIISNVSGKIATTENLTDPKYWSRHLRSTVKFYEGINEIIKEYKCLFIEVGPGKSLTNSVNTIFGGASGNISINTLRHPRENKNDYSLLLEQLGKLWSVGEVIKWQNLTERRGKIVSLPTYSFKKTSFPVLFNNKRKLEEEKSKKSKLQLNRWFSIPVWNRDFAMSNLEDSPKEKFLVFGYNNKWCEEFRENLKSQCDVLYICHSPESIASNNSPCNISFDNAKNFDSLWGKIVKNEQFDYSVLYLSETEENDQNQHIKLNQLINIIRFLNSRKTLNIIKLSIVTKGLFEVIGNEVLNPNESYIIGPALVTQQEFPNIKIKVIELSNADNDIEAEFTSILKEIVYDSNNKIVALRNGFRWLPDYRNIESNGCFSSYEYFIKNGVYLITGGLGDIGFAIAEMLVNKYDAKVILTGRKDIDNITVTNINPDIIERINLVKSKSNSFIYYKADVSTYCEMKAAVDFAEMKFGKINGIIHSAGIIDDSLSRKRILDITSDNTNVVFAPKVSGTNVIGRIADEIKPEWVILMSSLSSILGGYGLASYSSANAYLDVYSLHRRKTSKTHWLSINWDGWSFRTEANDFISKIMDDVHLIEKQEGLTAFAELLKLGKMNQVVVSLTDLNSRITKWTESKTDDSQSLSEVLHERPDLSTTYEAPQDEIQNEITEIWSSFFGYDKIGVNDDFFELGGDSLKVVGLTKLLSDKMNFDIEVKDFIKNSTIQKLSKLYTLDSNLKNTTFKYPHLEHDEHTHYDSFPLTPVQLAYFAGKGGNYELGNISTHGYIEIETQLDVKNLQIALNKVIQRHAALRMVLTNEGRQRFLETTPEYIIEFDDLTRRDTIEINAKIEAFRDKLSHQIFDTFSWPLFEVKAIQISKEKLYLFVSIDIIICDANSLEIFASDLMHFYYKPEIELDNLNFTFNDYMRGFNQVRASELYTRDKNYWLSKLDGFPYGTGLPLKSLSNEVISPKFSRFETVLDKDKWHKIKSLAASNNITPSVFMGTAFASVLSYWSNQDFLGINLTFFNRMPFHKDVTKMIGDFTSLMILGINYNASLNFYENALNFQEQLFDAIEHKHFDGVEFIGELRKFNKLGNKAVMPIVFTSTLNESEHFDSSFWNNFGEIKKSITQTPQVYLDHQLRLQQGKLFLVWDYVEQMFDNVFVENMFNSYINLLNDLLQDKSPSFPESNSLTAILDKEYNSTQQHFEFELLDRLFQKSSVEFGEKVAIIDKHGEITFNELEKKSNSVANYLIENGIKPNILVGVLAQRNINTIINVLGIQKAGGAYVPIDPNQPEKRNAIVIKNCEINIILNSDKTNEIVLKYSSEFPDVFRSLDDLAYVIHTSGSTGIPKGVMIDHQEAVNTILDINNKFDVCDRDSILGISSLCFDLSVYDIFGAFASGATLNLLEDPRNISEYKNKLADGITIWNSVPALLEMFIKGVDQDYLNTTVRLILLSGDWIPLYLVGKAKMHFPNAKIISLGGATEGSIWSIYYPITKVEKDWKSIPYGYPLANQQMYVLSKWLELCPIDVKGEIYIGGMGVANGYLNDIAKTDNAYISHPKFGKIYKTGDQGVFRKDGYIEFSGRVDHQVKIRGYRIELGEIENTIQKLEHIKQCRAIVKEIEDEKYIVCYIVADELINIDDIKTYASEKLPSYMVPSYIQQIDNIPLTSNGKVDVRNLPEIEQTKKVKNVRPKDNNEFKLLEIYSQVLNRNMNNISLDEPIANLGVSSIKIVEIYQKITKEFDIEINIAELFKYQTIGEYALYFKEQLDRKLPEEDELSEDIRKNRSDNKKLQFNKRKQLR